MFLLCKLLIVLLLLKKSLGPTLYLGIKSNLSESCDFHVIKSKLEKERVGVGSCRLVIQTSLRKVRAPERPNLLDNVQCE